MKPSFAEALRVWLRVAALSFGGPAGQIAVMHRILVQEKRWIPEARFLHALNYCMLLPGPEAQQLATYTGWLLHGWRGGLTAGLLFILPGFASILALSVLYVRYADLGLITAVFYGLKAAVAAIVVQALLRIGGRALVGPAHVAIAAAAFVALFFFAVPYPIVVVAAAAFGLLAGGRSEAGAVLDEVVPSPPPARTAATVLLWLAIWLVPLGLLAWRLGSEHVLVREGAFFSKVAMVTFGGAYAVLGYVAQQAVAVYGWLQPGEMLDGLGMAETTPGPLIQVVQFVGFLGAYRAGTEESMSLAVAGSVVVTWMTFAPCFLLVFAGAPYVEALRRNRALTAALTGVTAAVVGAVLNLATWFTLHVLFATVDERWVGPLRLLWPRAASIDVGAALIALGAAIALLRFRVGLAAVLVASVLAGLILAN